MRSVLIAGLTVALAAPPAAAQETPPPPAETAPAPPDGLPAPAPDAPRVVAPRDIQPGDPIQVAPNAPGGPLHPGDEILPPDAGKAKAPMEKPKLGEAAGSLAGGIIGQVAGTAAGGPLGGLAASIVGDKVGSSVVRAGKKLFGRGKKATEATVQQAAAAPERGADTATTEAAPSGGPP